MTQSFIAHTRKFYFTDFCFNQNKDFDAEIRHIGRHDILMTKKKQKKKKYQKTSLMAVLDKQMSEDRSESLHSEEPHESFPDVSWSHDIMHQSDVSWSHDIMYQSDVSWSHDIMYQSDVSWSHDIMYSQSIVFDTL